MNVAGFYDESLANGKGFRAVLFVSGCPHRCEGCHNQITWDANCGVPFVMEDYIKRIKENPILDGVTISGGEPFLYPKELIPFLLEIKALGFNVWAYSGYIFEQLVQEEDRLEMLKLIDVLVDGKFVQDLYDPYLDFKGSSNQRVIDVQDSLRIGGVVVIG